MDPDTDPVPDPDPAFFQITDPDPVPFPDPWALMTKNLKKIQLEIY